MMQTFAKLRNARTKSNVMAVNVDSMSDGSMSNSGKMAILIKDVLLLERECKV